jgi:hypothetical protein
VITGRHRRKKAIPQTEYQPTETSVALFYYHKSGPYTLHNLLAKNAGGEPPGIGSALLLTGYINQFGFAIE